MVLLDCEEFLEELTKMVHEDSYSPSKSLWITYKRCGLPSCSDFPNTRSWRRKKSPEPAADADPVCLVRAKIGKRKISTYVGRADAQVPNAISESFTAAINTISESIGQES